MSTANQIREAEVLASLNHPNIAQIYGLEEPKDTRCIVMELVEGDTLQDRLKRGSMPVDAALTIARQTAEALEAAHERGIVHRYFKPANIKVTSNGKLQAHALGHTKSQRRPAKAGWAWCFEARDTQLLRDVAL